MEEENVEREENIVEGGAELQRTEPLYDEDAMSMEGVEE